MNFKLMQNIIQHIFCNLRIIDSDFIAKSSQSILSEEFKLNHHLTFDLRKNPVFGTKLTGLQHEIFIIVGDCSTDIKEYCALIQLKDAPTYGLYLRMDQDGMPLLACSTNADSWMICNTYLQACFLAGMEQVKDMPYVWEKLDKSEDLYQAMVKFINYYEEFYEGEEDRS